ncbi:hypothetical protein GQ43DRAFT_500221 [Delitschia confertaspora ATCC 74209]|uniref:Retrotransposon gag domain-containing protein n=1 Tax=Delitschia confertaspora ATCC 74209 TaxID=1513339 RepID=A0A9P4MMJ8_9PLEO|nr:hypothetical protein GQ43DRAFT_500221 [Delitschia confertaspora ATCC 74209]
MLGNACIGLLTVDKSSYHQHRLCLSPALIEQLVEALLNQQLASTAPAPAPIPVITPSALKNKPPVYDGAPSSYEIFKYKAMEIIRKETNLFFDNRSITGFIFSCCTGRAETMIWPWYNNKLDCTPEEMWDHMDSQFIDKTSQIKAMSQLQQLKQKPNESAHDLCQRFDTLTLQAGLQGAHCSNLIQYLESALCKELKELLVTIDAPNDVKKYQAKIVSIEERANRLRCKHKAAPLAPTHQTQSSNNSDTMDWEATPAQVNAARGDRRQREGGQRGRQGGRRGRGGGNSNGNDNSGKQRAKWVSKD